MTRGAKIGRFRNFTSHGVIKVGIQRDTRRHVYLSSIRVYTQIGAKLSDISLRLSLRLIARASVLFCSENTQKAKAFVDERAHYALHTKHT